MGVERTSLWESLAQTMQSLSLRFLSTSRLKVYSCVLLMTPWNLCGPPDSFKMMIMTCLDLVSEEGTCFPDIMEPMTLGRMKLALRYKECPFSCWLRAQTTACCSQRKLSSRTWVSVVPGPTGTKISLLICTEHTRQSQVNQLLDNLLLIFCFFT